MAEDFVYDQEKVSFKSIVLAHLSKILSLSTNEFRGGYWKTIPSGHTSTQEYVPDSRKCYIQAVESLASILFPYFDDEMLKEYEKLIKTFDMEYVDFIHEYSEEVEDYKKKYNVEKNKPDFYRKLLRIYNLRDAKELFKELNKLLNRIDYLKSAIYEEE